MECGDNLPLLRFISTLKRLLYYPQHRPSATNDQREFIAQSDHVYEVLFENNKIENSKSKHIPFRTHKGKRTYIALYA